MIGISGSRIWSKTLIRDLQSEEQLETKFSRETENVFTISLYYDVEGIGATLPPFLLSPWAVRQVT